MITAFQNLQSDNPHEAAAAGIQIDVLPIHYRINSEVLVEGLYAPIEAREGQTISLRFGVSRLRSSFEGR